MKNPLYISLGVSSKAQYSLFPMVKYLCVQFKKKYIIFHTKRETATTCKLKFIANINYAIKNESKIAIKNRF